MGAPLSQYLQDRTFPILVQSGDSSVAPANSARATFRVACGPTYDSFYLYFLIAAVGATRAQIDAQVAFIKLFADGRLVIDWTGLQATAMAEFVQNASVVNGVLPIFFADFMLEDPANTDSLAYGTADLDSLALEVTYAAAGVTITSHALYVNARSGEDLAEHCEWQRMNATFGTTGLQVIDNIPREATEGLYAIHIAPPAAGTLSLVEILADGVQEVYAPPNVIHARYKDGYRARQVQTNWPLHIDFSWRGRHADRMPLSMKDLRIRLTWATAAPVAFDILLKRFVGPKTKSVAA